jgi:hypothetical protein
VLRLFSSFVHAITNTPVEPQVAFHSLRLWRRPSPLFCRVGFHIELFEACSAFTHVTACTFAKSLRTFYTGGFSRFVASTTAPIATGWSESCRAGFAPAEKQRLCTAHRTIVLFVKRDFAQGQVIHERNTMKSA